MIFLDLIHNIALLVASSVLLSLVSRRWGVHTPAARILSGLLFGAVVLVGMATPVSLGQGVIFDGRSIVLCAAGVVGGPAVAGIAAAIAIAYRVALGGAGALVGVLVILESAAAGVAFYYLRRRRPEVAELLPLLALGLVVHALMLALFTQLPGGLGTPAMRQVALVALTVYPLATAAVCWFLLEDDTRVALREALAASEEQLALAIEASRTGLWDWDLRTGDVTINERWAELVGYTAEELAPVTYDTWRRLVHPADLVQAERAEELHLSGAAPSYRSEIRMRHKGGYWVWVATMGQVTERDAAGRPIRMTGTHIDISESKDSEAALQASHVNLERMVHDVAESMGRVVEARDPYTQGHQQRVAGLARQIADRLGMGEDEADAVEMAGLLHDVGKLHVPAEILTKPGQLSDAEFALIREHPQQGYEILKDISFPWPIADVVLRHHERMDGTGYPAGLRADEIPIAARILAVADVVEAMASHRPYRPSLGLEDAMAEIRGYPEKYDRDVVAACIELYDAGLIEL